jgi:ArsR family transcriptional regulator
MLWLLFNERELCVCDFMRVLEITQSKASRHLITLRHAGLVTDRKDGLWSYYQLCPVEDELVKRHLEVLRATLAEREDAAELLDRLHASLRAKHCETDHASGRARANVHVKGAAFGSKRARLAGGSR